MGQITTLPGLQVTQVTENHLVGIETDSLGVKYLVVYGFNWLLGRARAALVTHAPALTRAWS